MFGILKLIVTYKFQRSFSSGIELTTWTKLTLLNKDKKLFVKKSE